MPYRTTPFTVDNFYHIFNRGVEKRTIFTVDRDYQRFLETLYYYQFNGPKPRFSTYSRFKDQNFFKNKKLIEVNCYCLMANHFHLIVREVQEGGIHDFMTKMLNSYTKYYNTKHNRIGPLFQGQFKAVLVESNEQLMHLSRYIHLNPFVSEITKDYENFPYSSYSDFIGNTQQQIVSTNSILSLFSDSQNYQSFVKDHESYALELEKIKHLLIDQE